MSRLHSPSRRSRTVPLAAVLAALASLAGCGVAEEADDRSAGALRGEILVSAAASLTDAFADMAEAFEAAHPGVEVGLNLGSSSALRAQILEGAPADVYAPANRADMERVAAVGAVAGEPRVFARNRLRIVVPAGNPGGVGGLEDLARPELWVGICAAAAPCGVFTRRALDRADVVPAVDTEEPDVRALLTKLRLGELDVGVVYATDAVSAAGEVESVAIPDAVNQEATYPIAVLAGSDDSEAARAFVEFVLSPAGQEILARHGFGAP